MCISGYSFASATDIADLNEEALRVAVNKKGIPINRYENFRIEGGKTIYDVITTCMSGSNNACFAGKMTVTIPNP